ncbi:nuclear transport factor 2 family protein [Nocardia sp. NPDC004123]
MTEQVQINDPVAAAVRFLEFLSVGDVDGALAMADNDVFMSIPYQPPGYPTRIEGSEKLRSFLRRVLGLFSPISFRVTEALSIEGGTGAVARYEGRSTMLRTGNPYNNSYISIFRFSNGKLVEWTEFANPLVLLESFGEPNG